MSAIFLYRVLQVLGIPLIVVYFLVRGIRDRRYFRSFPERLGFLPRPFRQTGHGAIWLHAVSVGEVLAASALVRELRARFPETPLFVSSTTIAGKPAAEEKLRGIADGVFYAPLDYASAVRRVLRTIRPRVVVVLETEIWPNLYREAKRAGCGVVVVNGRISGRALPRYRRLRWAFRQVLAFPDAILAQSAADAARYEELGAPRVRNAGNLKYDFDTRSLRAPAAITAFLERTAPRETWIAASTMAPAEPGDPDEDEAVIAAFRELAASRPGLLLVLVPRKPERFDTAAEALARAGVPFVRRSQLDAAAAVALPGVLLLDSIGELGSLFAFSDVVFMGGTLAHRGGHNVLEPALAGKPVIVGPHMENFAGIAEQLRTAGALVTIRGPEELAGAVRSLLAGPEQRARIGGNARAAAERERGATARAADEIERLYSDAVPRYRPAAPLAILAWPLSRLWLAGAAIDRRRSVARQERLATPVVSIGGLTAGGTGKTPVVAWLAERLRECGRRPAILTRGYRRKSAERYTIVAPGERPQADRTGDEPQTYIRAGLAPLGISADRAGAGRLIESRFHPGVFLLDDGFQHHRLARALDIVVLDALDPFGGGSPLPLGRLRESVEAIARAGAIVITRAEAGRSFRGIENTIRKYNPKAPVFTARVKPRRWVRALTGEAMELPPRVAAFCGLGNPDSFWRTLKGLGVQPVSRKAFPDHHRYSGPELQRLAREAVAAGAQALVTTEKDAANLGERWQEALLAIPVVWLEIGLEVDGGEVLVRWVEGVLPPVSE